MKFFKKRAAKREEKIKSWLDEADVPKEFHQEALESLNTSRGLYWRYVFIIKITAWLVTLPVVLLMKWSDEKVPNWARWYDNNISPNGDRNNWAEDAEGYGRRLPQPLDKYELYTKQGLKFNYYAWHFHVRFWLSRWIWLGWRNPGAGRALQVGPNVFNLRAIMQEGGRFEWPVETFGNLTVGKGKDGAIVYGTKVYRIGHHWQVINFRRIKALSWLGMSTNIGYKVNNLASDFPANEPTAALCVCSGNKPFLTK